MTSIKNQHTNTRYIDLNALFHRLSEWQSQLKGRAQLSDVDNRILRDIGISRMQIENGSTKASWIV